MRKKIMAAALALAMCLALLPATASAAEGDPPDWYFLFAILKNVDADGKDRDGKAVHAKYSMTQEEIDCIKSDAQAYEEVMERTGVMNAHVDVVEIDAPVTKLYNEYSGGSYIGTEQVTPLLKGKVNLDKYDHVFGVASLNIHTRYAALTGSPFVNGTGYSFVNLVNQENVLYSFIPEQHGPTRFPSNLYVHEYIHFLERLSKGFGQPFVMHDIGDKFYVDNPDPYACFTDIFLNRVKGTAETGTGVHPAVWQYPPHTLRSKNGWTIPTGVTNIVDWEFGHHTSLTRITIPASVTSIGYAAFWDTGIKDVYYEGTEKQWKAIEIGEYNGALTKAKIHYNSTGVNDQTTKPTNPTNPTNPTTTVNFTDVKQSDWFYSPVQWAVGKKITSGTTATTFSPKKECTIAEILTFLYQAYGAPEPTIENPYRNVKDTDWYAKPAIWAYENGLVTNKTFGSNTPCTRSIAVKFLWRLAGSPEAKAATFDDVPADASYAKAVNWAVEKGVTSGVSKTQFAPNSTCTRSQIVTFLYAALAK